MMAKAQWPSVIGRSTYLCSYRGSLNFDEIHLLLFFDMHQPGAEDALVYGLSHKVFNINIFQKIRSGIEFFFQYIEFICAYMYIPPL
jgi:hypothetical protein